MATEGMVAMVATEGMVTTILGTVVTADMVAGTTLGIALIMVAAIGAVDTGVTAIPVMPGAEGTEDIIHIIPIILITVIITIIDNMDIQRVEEATIIIIMLPQIPQGVPLAALLPIPDIEQTRVLLPQQLEGPQITEVAQPREEPLV